jgi:hypothetical protein
VKNLNETIGSTLVKDVTNIHKVCMITKKVMGCLKKDLSIIFLLKNKFKINISIRPAMMGSAGKLKFAPSVKFKSFKLTESGVINDKNNIRYSQ